MTIKKPEQFTDIEKASEFAQDVFHNLSLDDMKPGQLQTTTPTTKTLEKGRMRIEEEVGVPFLYIRTLGGDIYKFSGTLI